MHDWTRVDADHFHSFHLGWVVALAMDMNKGGLPKGFYALIEQATRKRPARRRVAIRRAEDKNLVAVAEIVTPRIKARRESFERFVAKATTLLRSGVHFLVVDPFPPTRRDPHGVHAAIWKDLVGQKFAPPGDKPLTLASYVAKEREYTAHVEPLAVGDAVPEMPLFLTREGYVHVPLGSTYETAWEGFPGELRKVVAGRAKRKA